MFYTAVVGVVCSDEKFRSCAAALELSSRYRANIDGYTTLFHTYNLYAQIELNRAYLSQLYRRSKQYWLALYAAVKNFNPALKL